MLYPLARKTCGEPGGAPDATTHPHEGGAREGAEAVLTSRAGSLADTSSIDRFLIAVRIVFAKTLTPSDVGTPRNNDIDNYEVEGEIEIRTTVPGGTQLVARKRVRRRTLRWVRLWPYVTIVLAAAVAVLLVWRGGQILNVLSIWLDLV